MPADRVLAPSPDHRPEDEDDHECASTTTREWNHGLGEIVTGLVEHDSLPWDALPGQMEPVGSGGMRLADRPERLPHSDTLQAVAPD